MDVIKAIRSRRSTRKYKSTEVPTELVMDVLEGARLAPSGNNTQPWRFVVVRDPGRKKKFYVANHSQKWLLGVPLFIVCVADLKARIKDTKGVKIDETSPMVEVKKIIRDTAIAADHLVLRAQELGLSTCWLAWFEQKDVRPIFGIPEDKYVVAVIAMGYGDENPRPRPRKKLNDMVFFEEWGKR